MQIHSSFINGRYSTPNSKKINVINKFDGRVVSKVTYCTEEDIEEAISTSKLAFEEYKNFSAGKRYDLIAKLVALLEVKKEDFATLIAQEAGKPISYARAEVLRCVSTLKFALEESRRVGGTVVPMDFSHGENRNSFTQKFPIGPIIAIAPFNFPLNLALHKIAPALACGCSIVLKPSPYTPLSSLLFAELVEQAGFPKGVLNVVLCSNEQSEYLVKHETFKMLSFTGSPKIGWMLKNIAGKKKVTLELGGNAAVIVDDSVDIKKIADDIAVGAYLYAGQICISTQRIIVEQSIYAEFKELLIGAIQNIAIGDPLDEQTIVGPLIDKEHLRRVESWVEESKNSGATILCGGRVLNEDQNLYEPTLIENHSNTDLVFCEEVFGPVATISSFKDFNEAITLVNDSKFGLQAGVFSNRLDRIKQAFNELEVGAVLVNSIPGFRIDHMPYGGVKDSGLGKEGLIYAISDMTEEKLLVL
ncbi:hypothetical protein A9Q84_11070 [Halobacteriovorax marinus]|uniref:Aldehyde dehydrogenase domain-containing protein n=1 Tax=Halobacteriovorax marinus TaxID=97084 RepID=A0A1Y5FDC6_9BACT|nr:hypothetical protein A9Q84_11070 [Halobacteriovorax marinus]